MHWLQATLRGSEITSHPLCVGDRERGSVCYSDLIISQASERAGPSRFVKDSCPRSWARLKVLGHRSEEALGSKETYSGPEHKKVKQLVNELKMQWKLQEFKQGPSTFNQKEDSQVVPTRSS